ncbi:MAG: hypothetical protein RLZ98_2308, partial [Pseudomonadota bacterium]
QLPALGALQIFAFALVCAVIVWLVGVIGAQVLKDVSTPSSAVLTAAVVGGLIGAALTLVPQVTTFVAAIAKGSIPKFAYPLLGAVLGYLVKR